MSAKSSRVSPLLMARDSSPTISEALPHIREAPISTLSSLRATSLTFPRSRPSIRVFPLADMGYFPADKGLPEVYAQTGEILAGDKPGRESADGLIAGSNIGISVNDIAMGHAILHKALETGTGTRLPL